MAKIGALPSKDIVDGFRGVIDFYCHPAGFVARRWPRSPGRNRNPQVVAAQGPFSYINKLASTLPADVIEPYQELALGSGLSWKDYLTRFYINGSIRSTIIPHAEDYTPTGEDYMNCRAYATAPQAIPHATQTVIAFTADRYDPEDMHDVAWDNSRFYAPVDGKYLIIANVAFGPHAVGDRELRILLNGVTRIADMRIPLLTNNYAFPLVTTIYDLKAEDYVEAQVFQDSGGPLNTYVEANSVPEFMIQRLGP